jgi:hypothetical protein
MITDILKYGVRYILSYAVVSVICTVLIVAGNDLLGQYSFVGNVSETFLQIDYKQWLPVCLFPLSLTALTYLLFVKLVPKRLPLLLSGIICGLICLTFIVGTGVCSLQATWYEIKNLTTFFMAGFSFAIMVEMLD